MNADPLAPGTLLAPTGAAVASHCSSSIERQDPDADGDALARLCAIRTVQHQRLGSLYRSVRSGCNPLLLPVEHRTARDHLDHEPGAGARSRGRLATWRTGPAHCGPAGRRGTLQRCAARNPRLDVEDLAQRTSTECSRSPDATARACDSRSIGKRPATCTYRGVAERAGSASAAVPRITIQVVARCSDARRGPDCAGAARQTAV